MTTGPLVVSRISVLSVASLIVLDSFLVALIYVDLDGRTARQRVAERFRERQWRAGVDGGDRGTLIKRLGLRRRLPRHIGETRLAPKGSRPREGQHYGHAHAGPRLLDRRPVCGPAAMPRQAGVLQRVVQRPAGRRLGLRAVLSGRPLATTRGGDRGGGAHAERRMPCPISDGRLRPG